MHAWFSAGNDQDQTVGAGAPTQPAGTAVVPGPPPAPQGFFARLGAEIRQDFESRPSSLPGILCLTGWPVRLSGSCLQAATCLQGHLCQTYLSCQQW